MSPSLPKRIMNETPKSKRGWRILRQILIALASLATLVALLYAEEDWRGKRAWENCKRELEAKGEVLDWNAHIPPPVPDDQNFFKAPKMEEWFVRNLTSNTNELYALMTNAGKVAVITNKMVAANFMAWSEQFEPDFDLMREALKRPCARMDGDYSIPYEQPIPNFVNVRSVAQTLAQRAKCDLLLGQPDKALQELTLLHDMCRLLGAAPTGKPMTLVAAMINVAVTGLYVDTIASGLQSHAWQEPQMAALQEQLKGINLPPIVADAFKMELVAHIHIYTHTNETAQASHFFADLSGLYEVADLVLDDASASEKTKAGAISRWLKYPMSLLLKFAPRGWAYQNVVYCVVVESKSLDGFDLEHDTIAPRVFDEAARNLKQSQDHKSPFKLLAAITVPNTAKATQTLAHDQTLANEAQIACALERYRLAHGEYPGTLDALSPQFIGKIPHDIIGGKPLIYRPASDGKFLLYSIGWNETDDGGQQVTAQTKNGGTDFTKGDWVWQYPPK